MVSPTSGKYRYAPYCSLCVNTVARSAGNVATVLSLAFGVPAMYAFFRDPPLHVRFCTLFSFCMHRSDFSGRSFLDASIRPLPDGVTSIVSGSFLHISVRPLPDRHFLSDLRLLLVVETSMDDAQSCDRAGARKWIARSYRRIVYQSGGS